MANDPFNDLLDILLPSDRGLVAVLQAYLDESEQGGIFSLAGFVFEKSEVAKFTEEWALLFGPYGFAHMADLHAREEQFNGIDADESKRLCTSAVDIINRRAKFSIAVGCSVAEVAACIPSKVFGRRIIGLGNHYPFCCHMAMSALGKFLRDRKVTEKVAYVFENGNAYQREANEVMSDLTPELIRSYRYSAHAFMPKLSGDAEENARAVPLQAADLYAWEYARYWNLTVAQRKIKMRRSIASILSSGYATAEFQRRHSINFFTGPPLWCAKEKLSFAIKDQIASGE